MKRTLAVLALTAALIPPGARGQEEPAQPRVEGSTLVFDGGERLDLERQEVVLDATICLQKGPIELFACAPGGKDHESILVLHCKPQNLHLALISLGLKDKTELGGGGPRFLGDPARPVGDRVVVEVEYEHEGKKHRVRAEDLVLNGLENRPMERAGWIFAGSSFTDEEDPETGKPTGRKIYLANSYRSIVTTYHDPTTLLDNPTPEGGDDDIFFANPAVLPPPGTRARVCFRLPTPEESRLMEQAEAQVTARMNARMKEAATPAEEETPPEGGEEKKE